MKEARNQFWNAKNRNNKAAQRGLTAQQVYTLASIVEEETNNDSDKILIASVYQNRLKKVCHCKPAQPSSMQCKILPLPAYMKNI